MASEITREEDEIPSCIHDKEAEKMRIKQIIRYQKSLYLSSSSSSCSSFSSAAPSASWITSPRKSSSLLDLMREGSTSLGRLFDMEHTSLSNYFKDYTVSPIIKPILLWGSDTDDEVVIHDDPWKEVNKIERGRFASRLSDQNRVTSSQASFYNEELAQNSRRKDSRRRRKLTRTKSYRRLPRLGLWRCRGFIFRLKLIRKLKIMIKGRIF